MCFRASFVVMFHLLCVVQVNGHSLVGADHHRAVEVLKLAGNSVVMIVARETLAPVMEPAHEPSTVEEVDGGMKIYAQVHHLNFQLEPQHSVLLQDAL